MLHGGTSIADAAGQRERITVAIGDVTDRNIRITDDGRCFLFFFDCDSFQ
jgi:hypothetical protein